MISGLVVPDRGTVRFDGEDITYLDATERVAARASSRSRRRAGVFGGLTVRDNLLAGATRSGGTARRTRGAPPPRRCERFPALALRLDQVAGSLSGGEQQMLAVAKALLLEPRLLRHRRAVAGLAPVVVEQLLGVVERAASSRASRW